jgi:hypothetical protein
MMGVMSLTTKCVMPIPVIQPTLFVRLHLVTVIVMSMVDTNTEQR